MTHEITLAVELEIEPLIVERAQHAPIARTDQIRKVHVANSEGQDLEISLATTHAMVPHLDDAAP